MRVNLVIERFNGLFAISDAMRVTKIVSTSIFWNLWIAQKFRKDYGYFRNESPFNVDFLTGVWAAG